MTDPFRYDAAAYVVGALEEDERLAFELHLAGCEACRASVDDVRDVPAALAQLSAEDLDSAGTDTADAEPPLPETLLPGLLRHVAAQQRRRRIGVGALGAFAAACLVVLAVALWPSSSSGPGQRSMTALASVPVSATVQLRATSWGTEIRLHCQYDSNVSTSYPYGLTVVDTAGKSHGLGQWTLPPGKGIDFTSGTSVPLRDIAEVQVTADDGTPLLQLTS